MATGSNIQKLPVKRVRPASKPARTAPTRKAAAKSKAKPRSAAKNPEKTSGFAVGVNPLNYAWIDATAAALGKSKQAVVDGIIGQLLHRATLGGGRKRR